MDHIGIDVHKNGKPALHPSGKGRPAERAADPFHYVRFAAVLGDARGPASSSRLHRERVGGAVSGTVGHEVIVADPNFAPMYAARSRKIKTDRRDARALAEACRLGAYRPAHRLSDVQRHVRGRLTVRDALVRTRTGYISVVHHGSDSTAGACRGPGRCRGLHSPGSRLGAARPAAVAGPRPLLAVMRQVNQQVAYSDQRIAAIARADARVERLQSVPCVGPVTAAAFVAALDDAGRFARAHQVEAYLGLVPREWRFGGGPTARADHQGGPSAGAFAVGPGRGVDPAWAASHHHRPPGSGPSGSPHGGAADRRGRVGPTPGRDPLCTVPRWHPVSTPHGGPGSRRARGPWRRSPSESPHDHASFGTRRVRRVGERVAFPGPPHEARNVDGAPTPRPHSCTGEPRSPRTSANRRMMNLARSRDHRSTP